LLRLLVFCNKYAAREFEEHLVTLVKPLVQADTLSSSLGVDLTVTEVLRIANMVDQPVIAEVARQNFLDELWGDCETTTPLAGPPYETLLFAESIGDKELIGAAYYQILISGDTSGSTPALRQTLDRGMIRCGEEWQKVFNLWGQGKYEKEFSCANCHQRHLYGIWSRIAAASLAWYDVVGKVRCAARWQSDNMYSYGCCSMKAAAPELARIKKEVYSYFMEERST
jgi:hypothetical protein